MKISENFEQLEIFVKKVKISKKNRKNFEQLEILCEKSENFEKKFGKFLSFKKIQETNFRRICSCSLQPLN